MDKHFFQQIWKFITSVKLAITLGIIIFIASMIGTFFEQEKAIKSVYKQWWFLALLAIFAINLLSCTISRLKVLKMATLGTFISHIGILITLAGTAISGIWSVSGNVGLAEREFTDYFVSKDTENIKLPFHIYLEDFSLELYPPRLWVYYSDKHLETFSPVEDKTITVANDKYKIHIDKIFSNYQIRQDVKELSGEPNNPAILLEMYNQKNTLIQTSWLYGKDKNTNTISLHALGGQHIEISYIGCQETMPNNLIGETKIDNPELVVTIKDEKITRSFQVELGVVRRLSDNYSLQIERATLDYARRDEPDANLSPNNPALQVTIFGPQGEEKRWVFAKFPEFAEMHKVLYKNVSLIYQYPQSLAKIAARVFTLNNNHNYIHLTGAKEFQELFLDKDFLLEKVGYKIRLKKYCSDAMISTSEIDAGSNLENPVIKVRIQDPTGLENMLLLTNSNAMAKTRDGLLTLAYAYNQNYGGDIKNFNSTIKIIENGIEALTGVASVNHPLTYKGYRIYQNTYNPQNLDWTGLSIVKDPGIPFVYTGFIIICIGLVYASFVRPVFKKDII